MECLVFSIRSQRKEIFLTNVSVGTKLLLDPEAGNASLWILHYHSCLFDLATLAVISSTESFHLII